MRDGLYGFLNQFTNGHLPNRSHLIKISEDNFYYSLQNSLIVCCGENSCGESVYAITEKGKQLRDR